VSVVFDLLIVGLHLNLLGPLGEAIEGESIDSNGMSNELENPQVSTIINRIPSSKFGNNLPSCSLPKQ
jgi:hypothetical protein